MSVIFLLALLLRLFVSPLYHHSDPDTYYYWGKYLWQTNDFLGFLGKSVPNAMPATYPPVFYYLLYLWRGFYELIGKLFWWLNVNISYFPSKFILFFKSYEGGIAFNKLPAMLADLGCGYLIFRLIKEIGGNKKLAVLSVICFLLLPASWYNSAYWGQIDSLYSLFCLLAIYLVIKNKFILGTFVFGFSGLIKPTGLFILPVFILYAVKKKKVIDLLLGAGFLIITAIILYLPFFPDKTLISAVNFYIGSFKGELNYLVSNAFNFWSLIFGFDQRLDNSLILGAPMNMIGFLIFIFISGFICFNLWKKPTRNKLILALFLCAFSAFLFLPRMHERYFFTAYIFLAVMAGLKKSYFYIFISLSIIHFFNLYHFWWQPEIPVLIGLLSNLMLIRFIIVISLGIFIYLLFYDYKK